jgi:prepilin-type N-terminal cleavage/methylation domain-containing protein
MKHRRQAGYSLPEMLTVVAIIGVLALVTVPAFINFYQAGKMRASMRSFATDLRSIRQRAITRGHQTVLTYDVTASGATEVNFKRNYYFYEGNLPFNSTAWTPVALKATGTTAALHTLNDVIYFPDNAGGTPQTFDDTLRCSTTGCTNGTDSRPEVMFFPDGRVRVPSGSQTGQVTIKTNKKIAIRQYTIDISPSGNVKATGQ